MYGLLYLGGSLQHASHLCVRHASTGSSIDLCERVGDLRPRQNSRCVVYHQLVVVQRPTFRSHSKHRVKPCRRRTCQRVHIMLRAIHPTLGDFTQQHRARVLSWRQRRHLLQWIVVRFGGLESKVKAGAESLPCAGGCCLLARKKSLRRDEWQSRLRTTVEEELRVLVLPLRAARITPKLDS